jgi:hypothetical protein
MGNASSAPGNGGKPVARAKQPPARAKLRGLKTLDCLDGRTFASKRARSLADEIERNLAGDLTAAQRQLVQHASVLGALIESDESQWLGGKSVDLMMLFAAINSQRRILVTLGLERRSRDVTPDLQDYLREREEAAADVDEADTS